MPSREAWSVAFVRLALDIRDVHLLDLVAGMASRCASGPSFVSSSAPVVSASRRPTGTMPRLAPDEVDHRRTPLRVPRGGDDAGRLVQQHVGERLRLRRVAVELHDASRADERVQLPGSPFTLTRPALIRSSAPRREATPARAR